MNLFIAVALKPAIVLTATLLLTALLRKASASLRHALWLTAILGAAALPLADFMLPKLDLPLLVETSPVVVTLASPAIGAAGPGKPVESNFVGLQNTSEPEGFGVMPIMLALWLAGFLVSMARLMYGIRAADRLIGMARTVSDPAWIGTLEALRHKLGIGATVRLVSGAGTVLPMMAGIRHSVIVLPAGAEAWSQERRRMVLTHELAHVKRHDRLFQLLTQVVCGLYWFNPLFRYAARAIGKEREHLCDDHVLKTGVDPFTYAAELVELARIASASRVFSSAYISMAAPPSQLESRLRAIVNAQQNRRVLGRPFSVLLWLTVLGAIYTAVAVRLTAMPVPTLTFPAAAAPVLYAAPVEIHPAILHPEPSRVPAVEPRQASTVYTKWLDEDVAYIINDEERAAFLKLTSDAERDQFITQFWIRRNPVPDSTENAFKAEHYARISYTQARFGWDGHDGWKSDRGRIYIKYGKPDQVDSHPASANGNSYPYDVWKYNAWTLAGKYVPGSSIQISFEFIDPGKTGEYRLNSTKVPGQGAEQVGQQNWAGTWKANAAKSSLGIYPSKMPTASNSL